MTKKRKIISIVIAILGLALFGRVARADAPPPPPFTVYVNYQGQKISDAKFFAEALKCDKEKSTPDASVLPQFLISKYDAAKNCYWEPNVASYPCANSQCEFNWLLGDFKIAVYLPSLNKTFVSNDVDREYSGHYGGNTPRYYQLDLTKDGNAKLSETIAQAEDNNSTSSNAVISDMSPPTTNIRYFVTAMLVSLIITLILELITALVFALIKKAPKKILLGVLIGNVISVPLLWLVVSRFDWTLFPAEIFVVIFEAWLIKLFSRGKLTWQMCLLLSFIMNLVSFLFGPFFYRFL